MTLVLISTATSSPSHLHIIRRCCSANFPEKPRGPLQHFRCAVYHHCSPRASRVRSFQSAARSAFSRYFSRSTNQILTHAMKMSELLAEIDYWLEQYGIVPASARSNRHQASTMVPHFRSTLVPILSCKSRSTSPPRLPLPPAHLPKRSLLLQLRPLHARWPKRSLLLVLNPSRTLSSNLDS